MPIGISCTWKCKNCCNIHYKDYKDFYKRTIWEIINDYDRNKLVSTLILSGLEPFDNFDIMLSLIHWFRVFFEDDIVIYSGYELKEIEEYIKPLSSYNVLVKYGRYMPNKNHIYNEDLELYLSSDNQRTIHI